MRRSTMVTMMLLVSLLVTACGDSAKVGSDRLMTFEEEAARRLGESTPDPKQTPADPPPEVAPSAPTPQEQQEQPQEQQEQQVAIDIAVRGDDASGSQFDPPFVRVFTGSLVQWTNHDSRERSVVSDLDIFDSGSLAPGDSFVWEATDSGVFNYHDGTRPYAVGRLEVIAR